MTFREFKALSSEERTVTVNQVMAWEPCYDSDRVEALFAGRECLTALEIADLDIHAEYRVWALCHEELLTPCELRTLACRFVRGTPLGDGRTVWALLTDQRSRAAVEVAERYVLGEATDEDLAAARSAAFAAWAAARAAARSAAETAARSAARDAWAARSAARSAAEAASRDAEAAAEAAARSAAFAAWAAARAAAWDAWAAEDAAREWQLGEIRRLLQEVPA